MRRSLAALKSNGVKSQTSSSSINANLRWLRSVSIKSPRVSQSLARQVQQVNEGKRESLVTKVNRERKAMPVRKVKPVRRAKLDRPVPKAKKAILAKRLPALLVRKV